jgi:hypothetical protein
VNFTALESKLVRICRNRVGSLNTSAGTSDAMRSRNSTPFEAAAG